MSETRLWNCDGCDEKTDATERKPPDWKRVTVEVTGLAGYPTCQPDEVEQTYHLCPACALKFQSATRPKTWDRITVEATPQ